MIKRLESCEVWFLRRMMRISWKDKVSNEEVFRRAGTGRKLIFDLRMRQMKFLGHVMRNGELENLAMTGKIEGKRSRGRRRVLWMSSFKEWLEEAGVKDQETAVLLEKALIRELWQDMIAQVEGYGT